MTTEKFANPTNTECEVVDCYSIGIRLVEIEIGNNETISIRVCESHAIEFE